MLQWENLVTQQARLPESWSRSECPDSVIDKSTYGDKLREAHKPTMREAYKPTMQEAYNAGGLQCGRPTMQEAYNAGGHMQVVCQNPEHISGAKNIGTPECFLEECYKCYSSWCVVMMLPR